MPPPAASAEAGVVVSRGEARTWRRSPAPKIVKEALTFDDVLLIPGHSLVHPKDTDVFVGVTRGITLEHSARVGRHGHRDRVRDGHPDGARRGASASSTRTSRIERQAEEVDRVKRSESGMILNPITLHADATLQDAHALMARFSISGVPIVERGKLVGIITNRDLQFETDLRGRSRR
jgi:IMP dehydrogenase